MHGNVERDILDVIKRYALKPDSICIEMTESGFMDMTPATLIFTPIFLPVCTALGMNTIHFGIMLIFNLCIGTITPPVGTTLFVGVKVGGVKIETVFKHLLPYFFAIIVVLMLVTYIPQLSLWLPGLMGYVS